MSSTGRARTRASSTSAMATSACSRWKSTTIPRSSSPIRARRPGSAAFCATFSPWARGPSPRSTSCASARPIIPRPGASSPASSPGSAATAIRSACRRSAARPASIGAMTATSSSTRWRSASPGGTRSSLRPRPASAIRSSISARRPGATASMARAWPRPPSRRTPKRSARPSRSAIRSPRSCCSKPASN